jgi:hypothetical protein
MEQGCCALYFVVFTIVTIIAQTTAQSIHIAAAICALNAAYNAGLAGIRAPPRR